MMCLTRTVRRMDKRREHDLTRIQRVQATSLQIHLHDLIKSMIKAFFLDEPTN